MALEFDWLSRLFSVDMGIDLGTCNTLVCVRGEVKAGHRAIARKGE